MIAPAAAFVEAAVDSLKDPDYLEQNKAILAEQKKQYFSALPNATEESYAAYALGMMTARILLLGNPLAARVGISI